MSLRAEPLSNAQIGYFQIWVQVPGHDWHDVTMFRGAPCQVGTVESSDPFGDASCSITFPQITVFDAPGQGDLWWLVPYANVDIRWFNLPGYDYNWRWEGFIVSENVSFGAGEQGLSVECKGALYQLDDYLAQPWFPSQPVPYELLIKAAFDPKSHPGLRTRALDINWPTGWDTRVPEWNEAGYLRFLKPWGVSKGQRWTGLTTRSTGGWEPLLTGFIQGLLSVMFENGGAQWTIYKRHNRKPELTLRQPASPNDDDLIRIQVGDPGVEIQMSRDFTQSANVIYGQGQDTAGTSYSGAGVVAKNNRNTYTTYRPFAWSPYVHPRERNPQRNHTMFRKEAHIKFPTGMDELGATRVAQAQLQRFADPGFTGTVTLRTDPMRKNGQIFPRILIQAGDSILLEGVRGLTEGIVAHVTKVSVNVADGVTSLTYDTKYRDQLTVQEVRARTLDSLTPLRSLQTGKYSNTVQDLLLPWSYAEGSGCIPSIGGNLSKGKNATEFFTRILPDNAQFPWEGWTRKYPPNKADSEKFYIKIGPADLIDARNNWSGHSPDKKWYRIPLDAQVKDALAAMGKPTTKAGLRDAGYTVIDAAEVNAPTDMLMWAWYKRVAYPIKMAQMGTIRLIQIAAYDRQGNLKPVRFHVSLYSGGRNQGITQEAMPKIPRTAVGDKPIRYIGPNNNLYRRLTEDEGQTQPMPFFEHAFENVKPSGYTPGLDTQLYQVGPDAKIVVGWGNFFEPAGYWPGRGSLARSPSGMLVDETSWTFDVTKDSLIDDISREKNRKNEDAGNLYVMIYCDDQGQEPVYFMGRAFRQEPGT